MRVLSSSCRFGVQGDKESRQRERAEGVLVTPDWPGSGVMSLLEERVRMRKLRLVEQFYPVLECPKEIITDTFRGVPKFCFNAYVFEF